MVGLKDFLQFAVDLEKSPEQSLTAGLEPWSLLRFESACVLLFKRVGDDIALLLIARWRRYQVVDSIPIAPSVSATHRLLLRSQTLYLLGHRADQVLGSVLLYWAVPIVAGDDFSV